MPFDASVGDLVARRDQSRCRVTQSDRQQLDEPEPTFIVPPVLSELGDAGTAEVTYLFLEILAFNTDKFDIAPFKVATKCLHDGAKSGALTLHGVRYKRPRKACKRVAFCTKCTKCL